MPREPIDRALIDGRERELEQRPRARWAGPARERSVHPCSTADSPCHSTSFAVCRQLAMVVKRGGGSAGAADDDPTRGRRLPRRPIRDGHGGHSQSGRPGSPERRWCVCAPRFDRLLAPPRDLELWEQRGRSRDRCGRHAEVLIAQQGGATEVEQNVGGLKTWRPRIPRAVETALLRCRTYIQRSPKRPTSSPLQ